MRRHPLALGLAALLAMECVLLLYGANLSSLGLTGDAVQYDAIARNLLHHGAFSTALSPPYYAGVLRTPGYPLFLAPFRAIDTDALLPVRIAQFCLIGLTAALVYGVGRRLAT